MESEPCFVKESGTQGLVVVTCKAAWHKTVNGVPVEHFLCNLRDTEGKEWVIYPSRLVKEPVLPGDRVGIAFDEFQEIVGITVRKHCP